MDIKSINIVNESDIEREWDNIADFRDKIILSGEDISLIDVTEPFVLEFISSKNINSIIDCGCGTGHLSYLISKISGKNVVGIDISSRSIKIAKNNYRNRDNLAFIHSSIINYFEKFPTNVDACVANMVLMDIVELEDNLKAIYNLLTTNGYFCFTITHPCFWSIYWNYFNESWFNYNSEICITAPLKINGNFVGETTHIHRPLTQYISLCNKVGLEVVDIEELYPQQTHQNYKYDYPRFMGFICRKKII